MDNEHKGREPSPWLRSWESVLAMEKTFKDLVDQGDLVDKEGLFPPGAGRCSKNANTFVTNHSGLEARINDIQKVGKKLMEQVLKRGGACA